MSTQETVRVGEVEAWRDVEFPAGRPDSTKGYKALACAVVKRAVDYFRRTIKSPVSPRAENFEELLDGKRRRVNEILSFFRSEQGEMSCDYTDVVNAWQTHEKLKREYDRSKLKIQIDGLKRRNRR